MKKITLFVFLMLLSVSSVFSQEITEGREFWFGLPYCKKINAENPRGMYPVYLWLSSKYDTKATIKINATEFEHTFEIKSNKVTEVGIDDAVMCTVSEVTEDNGIHIKAESPISVSVYYCYSWSGEAFRAIPIDWLGKNYVSVNLYEDKGTELKPPQILIIAAEDNTVVYYTPSKATVKADAGVEKEVKLNKGQTFLILGREDKNVVQSTESDITGTIISANKPIAVISGHTKGGFPRLEHIPGYPDDIPEISRNVLMEQLLPNELLGTEYLSAPLMYSKREIFNTFPEWNGELIRFVAAQDSTIIYQMRQDGTGFKQITVPLKAGEYFDIASQGDAAYYKSNNPILVAQYGKAVSLLTYCYQGMLLSLIPIKRWCSNSVFYSPNELDNFIYITFRYEDINNIFFDGTTIASYFGNQTSIIPGTPFAYITQQIEVGNHYIEGRNGAKFGAYAYGNMDMKNDGFAYGYPLGANYADFCEDSLFVDERISLKRVQATAYSIDKNPESNCAGIHSIWTYPNDMENYKLDMPYYNSGEKSVFFELKVLDSTKNAFADVNIMNRSGYRVVKHYSYIAPEIPPSVKLVAPNTNSANMNTTVDLVWDNTARADGYNLQISKTESFFAKLYDSSLIYDTHFSIELELNTKYYWRVRAGNAAGFGTWSQIWNFITYTDKAILISPPNNAKVEIDTIHFLWHSQPNALSYTYQRADDFNFQTNLYELVLSDTTLIMIPELLGKSYFWRVKANDSSNTGEWSDKWRFVTEFDIPQLIKPSKDTTNIPIEVELEWEVLENSEDYRLQVSKESNFQLPLLIITSPEHNYSYTFEKNTKYYWRVCAGDGENFGEWSEVWTFTTGNFSDVKNNIKTNNSFSIFPNPADNELYIEFSNDFSNNCEIEIIDMQGITVSSIKKSNLIYGTNKEQISLEDLPVGTYYCVLKIGGNRYSKMFVKM